MSLLVSLLVSLEIVKKSCENFEMSKLFVFLVLCIVSASCAQLELENLCSSDHFEYNGTLVNTFYKERWNMTFPSLSHCLINSSVACDRSEFVNKTNYWEVLRIKNAL